ncbi:MAG TPA: alpha-1,2-fucosyltransferase [Candidatus Saccharimonadales bacterium]|nr:alpha-1,2-fucosyltransferase [Candidatus Saccharimonadales bacterium]
MYCVIGQEVGGLGNQLFIIAAAISYALRNHLQPKILSYWSYKTSSDCVGREQSPIIRNACIDYIITPDDISKKNWYEYKEPHWHYTPIPYIGNTNVKLCGYFQSELYFKEDTNIIRQLFYPKINELEKIEQYSIFSNSSQRKIAVHIRRTDYVKLSWFHHNLPQSYYDHAMMYFKNKYPHCQFIFFTDDKQFVKQKCHHDVLINDTDVNEFRLMTQCDDFIIANSTFSWWGAWLSKSDCKTVIAPKTWFLSGISDWQSIYCDGWIVMDDDGTFLIH